jgi:hypothetical protein
MLRVIAPEFAVPLSAGLSVVRNVVGEDNYSRWRSRATWGYGLINGFSPISPQLVLMPVKIALFIVIILVCILAFGWSGLASAAAAYFGQAIIVALAAGWMADRLLAWGLGA